MHTHYTRGLLYPYYSPHSQNYLLETTHTHTHIPLHSISLARMVLMSLTMELNWHKLINVSYMRQTLQLDLIHLKTEHFNVSALCFLFNLYCYVYLFVSSMHSCEISVLYAVYVHLLGQYNDKFIPHSRKCFNFSFASKSHR